MADRPTIVITSEVSRQKAIMWCRHARWNTVVSFAESKRTLPQNARLHAMLTEVAQQHLHNGMRLSVTDWKRIFSAAMKRELRLVPNLDGDGMVMLGDKTSEMTKAELSDMIELVYKYGAEWGVRFSEDKDSAARDEGVVNSAPSVAA